jgi:ABC-type transport system substrate-binding protein
VNAAADLSPTDITSVDTRRYVVSSKPIQSGVYAILNTKSQLLSDKVIRQALQLATNTQAIRDKLPEGTPALDLPFINGQLTGDVPTAPAPDLAKARQMLTDDGWILDGTVRKKDGVELKLTTVTTKDGQLERVLETLVGQWRALGVTVETKIVDPSDASQNVFQDILQPRKFDVLLYQVDIGADPDVFAYWHSSQVDDRNYSGYSNAVSDDALSSARARTEPALRNAKYITFAKQWLADVPAIGLYQSTALYVHNHNVRADPDSTVLVSPIDRYSDVLQWSVGTRSVYKTP